MGNFIQNLKIYEKLLQYTAKMTLAFGLSLHHTAKHCSTLQHTCKTPAKHLQHTCNTPATHLQQLVSVRQQRELVFLQHSLSSSHCNTLQHTATHRNTLQHICNTLQHTATRLKTHCNFQLQLDSGEGWFSFDNLSALWRHIGTFSDLAAKHLAPAGGGGAPILPTRCGQVTISVLQCVAVWCRCVAVCCSVLQCATFISVTLQPSIWLPRGGGLQFCRRDAGR